MALPGEYGDEAKLLAGGQSLVAAMNFRVVQRRLRSERRKVDLGVVAYVEGTGIGPYEGAKVQVMSSGRVSVVTGVGTQGQGHFTSFA